MNNFKISIITVCFNSEKTIEQTINSVLNQNYPNVEYIVIDGASKDRTPQIIKQYLHRINVYLSEPDKGLYDALNKGIKLTTGDVIGILHSDDFYPHQNVLATIAEMLDLHPEVEAVSSSVQIFKNENFKQVFRSYNARKFRLWQFRIGIQPPHPGFFIRRNALMKVGEFNTNYKISGDFDWLIRVLNVNKIKTFYTKFVTVFMRDGGISSSGFKSKKLMNSENLKSLASHQIYSNSLMIYSKYILKIFQINIFSFLKLKK